VASLNRPGGNLTGLTMMNTSLTAKQIELMHETLPAGAAIATPRSSRQGASPATRDLFLGLMAQDGPHPATIA
jgi:ABC-type uncharacterized transport system substrate-binding protein